MTVEACKRILWIIDEKKGLDNFTYYDLQRAIMEEVGTDPRTTKKYIQTLLTMGWIKRKEMFLGFTATEKGKTQ